MKRNRGFVVASAIAVATVVAIATGAMGQATQSLFKLVGLAGQVVGLIESNYVEEVPVSKLEEGALTGLVEAADPGGAWVPKDRADDYQRAVTRESPAFGLVIGRRSGYPFVLEVLPGSPAAQAGLEPGELIERVEGEHVRSRPLWKAQLALADGEAQHKAVTMDVIKRDLSGKTAVTLTPGPADRPAPSIALDRKVPVIRIPIVADQFVPELDQLLARQSGAAAIVVDLTGTALGNPRGALAMAATLVGGDLTLQEAAKEGPRSAMSSHTPVRPWKVTVCIDATTAHAGELLAVALAQRGATLVGRPTFGDTGQRAWVESHDVKLWLAKTWFLNAEGQALLGEGLKPAEIVRGRGGREAIVDRAVEIASGGTLDKAA